MYDLLSFPAIWALSRNISFEIDVPLTTDARQSLETLEVKTKPKNKTWVFSNIVCFIGRHLKTRFWMEKVFTNHRLASYLAQNDLEMRAKTLHGIDVKKHVYSLKYNL